MGNEMGNSNVSGLQEENRTAETAENSLQEAGFADNVKEENRIVPAVEDTDFHEKVAGLASGEGNQIGPAVEDTNFHEKITGLASGEGNQIVLAVEDTNFHEKVAGLTSGERNQIVPAVEDTNFHEKVTGLASGEGNQIVPAVEDTNCHEKITGLTSGEGNQIIPAVEDMNFHEKVTGLASDEGNQTGPAIEIKMFMKKLHEQDDSKIQPPPGSPQVVIQSKDGNTDSRIQPASLSADDENDETLIESNLEDKLLETSEKQIERQTSSEKEREERRSSSCTNSAPNSPEHLGYVEPDFDQHELDKIHADPSIENHNETMQGSKEILGLSLSCDSGEKGQSDAEIAHILAESIGFDTNPEIGKKREEMASTEEQVSDASILEEKAEIRDGDEVPNGLSKTSSGSENNSDGGLPMEMNLIRNGSLDIQQEAMGNKGDGGLPVEMNLIQNGSSDLQSEAIPLTDSLDSFQEVAKPEDKCVVLTEDTKLIGLGLENKDDMHDLCPTQFCEELLNESKTNKSDSSHSDHENDAKEGVMDTSCNSAVDKDFQVEEAKLLENAYKVHLCDSSPNSTLEELCKNPEEGTAKLSKMDTASTEFIVTDFNHEGEEPTEKNMVEEILEKAEYSYAVGNDIEERKTTEQSDFQSHPIDEAGSLLPPPPAAFPLQSQEHEPATVMGYESLESRDHSSLELQQHGSGEFSLIKASNLDASDLTMETLVFAVELTNKKPGQELSQSPKTTSMAAAQFETEGQSNEQCGKDETPAFPSGGYEAQEGVGRVSTESSPESLAIQAGMRKSPSFHFELLAEGSTEESDQTPLLYHDKTVTGTLSRGVDVNFRNPVGEYGPDSVQYQATPVEEDSLKLEKSDSEKSRTPFLSFLKEEEEACLVVSQQNQATVVAEKKAAKERRSRSSLFSNCICCATAIS
ncbi:hypothetical protein PVL29_006013 [Vitis rotundifolia]|uniref:Uncharacterized protein n=1 Tax=Vitis rotundifolia TaxID=103349 RepID=A0AA39A3V6_VITRO|nr:hypothetical protein PVL29_006013 [Vitis rotundifolia]